MSHSDGSTNAGHVDFRAIRRSDSLFLSWIVKVDPFLNPDPLGDGPGDILWFGIEQEGGKKPIVFRFSPATTAWGDAGNDLAYSVRVWKADEKIGTPYMDLATLVFESGSTTKPPPAWITTPSALWVASGAGESWAFQTVIPTNGTNSDLSDGLDIATEFKMWYQFSIELTDAGSNTAYYAWPRDPPPPNPPLPKISPDGVAGPWLSAWRSFTLAPAPPPGTCLGDLTIVSNGHIGTTNPSPSTIQRTLPTKPLQVLPLGVTFDDLVPRNTFFVRPTNNTASLIPNGDVIARFWVANWGSQADWEEILTPTDLWKEIPPPPPPPPPPPVVPPAPSNDLPVGLAPEVNRIELEWKMTVCEWFNFLPSTYSDVELTGWLDMNGESGACPRNGTDLTSRYDANIHQCILAELETPPGSPPRTFLRKSYWNNLTVVPASIVTRDAAISVRGLHRREGVGPKTVYLYVQTFNTPKRVTSGQKRRTMRVAVAHGADSLSESRDAVFADLRVSTVTPTYWVHVYRETADSIRIQGTKRPVLRAQTSFGYRVEHQGDLAGWKHALTDGSELTRLAPNFYRLTVPNDSFVTVTTTIEALEPKRSALSLHAGLSFPHGTFKNTHDRGEGITLDLERRLSGRFRLAALAGFHRFDGSSVSGPTSARLEFYHISGSLETFLTTGPVVLFVDAGGGMYRFKPGNTKPGAHAGLGLEFEPTLSLALGVSYRAHTVFTGGTNTTFSALQAGGRLKF